MTGTNTYDRKTTALLCIDFYNDFLSEEGKLWPWVKEMAKEVNLIDNFRTIVHTARELGITIGNIHRPTSWKQPNGKSSPKTPGAVPSTTISRRSQAISWRRSIGLPAASRTPTSPSAQAQR